MRPSSSTEFAFRDRGRYLWLAVFVVVSVAVWWPALVSTCKLALADDAYTHILLIVPFSLSLIYLHRVHLRTTGASAASDQGRWIGGLLLVAALLLRSATAGNLGHLPADKALTLSMCGLVLWWIGSAIVCFGEYAFRSLMFPLCFLFLVVPLPENAVMWTSEWLQNQSAIGTAVLFRLVHVPVTREGVMLSIPGMHIEVARECSSIRSSTILLVITLVLAHLFLRSWWRQIVVAIAIVPLSVMKNVVRIFTITELGTKVDRGYFDGRLHHHGGVLFLALAVAAVVGLIWALRRGDLPARAAA